MRVASPQTVVVLATLLSRASLAAAACPDLELAQAAYDRGVEALKTQDADDAVKHFTEANSRCPDPDAQLALASSFVLGKQPVAATAALNRYVEDSGAAADWCAILTVRRQISLLEAGQTFHLKVMSPLANARIYIRESGGGGSDPMHPGCRIQPQGDEFSTSLPRGHYLVTAHLEQYDPAVESVTLSADTTLDLRFHRSDPLPPVRTEKPLPSTRLSTTGDLVATPVSPRSEHKGALNPWYSGPENWVWIGSGVIGIGSVVAGIWALSLEKQLDRVCPQRECPAQYSSEVHKHDRLAMLSKAGLILAGTGALAGTGIYLLLREPTNPRKSGKVGCLVALGQVTCDWRF